MVLRPFNLANLFETVADKVPERDALVEISGQPSHNWSNARINGRTIVMKVLKLF